MHTQGGKIKEEEEEKKMYRTTWSARQQVSSGDNERTGERFAYTTCHSFKSTSNLRLEVFLFHGGLI
jgi:hypothetical protein